MRFSGTDAAVVIFLLTFAHRAQCQSVSAEPPCEFFEYRFAECLPLAPETVFFRQRAHFAFASDDSCTSAWSQRICDASDSASLAQLSSVLILPGLDSSLVQENKQSYDDIHMSSMISIGTVAEPIEIDLGVKDLWTQARIPHRARQEAYVPVASNQFGLISVSLMPESMTSIIGCVGLLLMFLCSGFNQDRAFSVVEFLRNCIRRILLVWRTGVATPQPPPPASWDD